MQSVKDFTPGLIQSQHEMYLSSLFTNPKWAQEGKLRIPPASFTSMGASFVHYEPNRTLLISIPVREDFANPMGFMQGGLLTAAFDNAFGPLSYLVAGKPAVSLDIHTNYIRGISIRDTLFVEARVIARGFRTIFLEAEAVNSRDKQIAKASSQLLIISDGSL